jgi:hypothetical protein
MLPREPIRVLRLGAHLHSLAALVLALTLGQDSSLSTHDIASEHAIRTIVAGQVSAWNAGNAKGYASDIASDVSVWNGHVWARCF